MSQVQVVEPTASSFCSRCGMALMELVEKEPETVKILRKN